MFFKHRVKFLSSITKIYLYIFDTLKPHFHIIKLGFTRVDIIFLVSAQKHGLLELVRTACNEYPQAMFLSRNKKNNVNPRKLQFCCMSFVCHFVLVFLSPFSIAITSLGGERANLGAFCTFVRFVLVWICRFPLPFGVWEGLRFVIVALPGLFSYPFFTI